MLSKKFRANERAVQGTLRRGRSYPISSKSTLKVLHVEEKRPYIAVVVRKGVTKTHVGRNELRRIGYNLFEKHHKKLKPGIYTLLLGEKLTPETKTTLQRVLDKYSGNGYN